ncbi:MAG: molybdate ABC transporter substrate-binding protein [Actinomycetota bacterium]|nr:molybdate ABC transporter substrate-binding protein [Actinomycetota bacterium]
MASALVAGGCGSDDDTEAAGDDGAGATIGGTVLVFAAASLTDAFADLEAAFEDAHPDADVQLNLAGSSSLREQVLAGAPADVFASANPANMAQLVEAGEVDGEPIVFVHNELRIAVPPGNPGGVAGLADLADDELLVGLCAEQVPCGAFAREALADAGVEPSIDTNEPDVRALLTKLGADELDAGIVYATDVIAAGDAVEGIEIPADQNVVADYPIAALANAPNPAAAAAFVELVLAPGGRDILADHGFDPA